ncbi:hypothetical protein [Cellulomonas bogoriensis]|uniref:Uncharacterized protein n=1 Tax=Cellulomonas bogoriensis 69B4 = DSM 16987 TaxID=1386082 RepID=A0A0A0C209_9CELL|nr:hypothetical protein [Cellulomonas bogoriensis]KGM13429.1 hypothetical protein N869_14160 [Cellulomonas bogoriensis 69B4 = DSM 16987]
MNAPSSRFDRTPAHPAPTGPAPADPSDLRPLLVEVEDEVRRRRVRLLVPAAAVLLLFGVLMLFGAGHDPLLGFAGAGVALFGVASTIVVVIRHRARGVRLRTERVDGAPATVVRLRAAGFWASMGVLGAIALIALVGGVVAASGGDVGLGVVLGVVAVVVGWPLVLAAVGRSVPGDVTLTAAGVRYRILGLESVIAWEHLEAVTVFEGRRTLLLHPAPDTSASHRYRTWPRRRHAKREGMVEVGMQDWGVLATDVGRLILHYAQNPSDRAELGTPAATGRWNQVTAAAVPRRFDQWVVGDPGTRSHDGTHPGDEGDAGWPLWVDTSQDAAFRSIQWGGRLWLALGVLLILPGAFAIGEPGPWGPVAVGAFALAGLMTVALGMVSPRPPGLVAAGPSVQAPTADGGVVLRGSAVLMRMGAVVLFSLAVGTAATTLLFATTLIAGLGGVLLALALLVVPVLVVTGRMVARELHLDEHGLTYRSRWSRSTVPWSRAVRADLLRDGQIRVGLPDGGSIRVDAGAMAASPGQVAIVLDRYARHDGPRGETRDLEGMRRALLLTGEDDVAR